MNQIKEAGNIQSSISYFENFNFNQSSFILDIGTRYGTFIHHLYQRGYSNAYGIDINENVIDQGKAAYPTIKSNLFLYDGFHIPFQDNYFEIITLFDVLEHIPNIEEFLEETYRVLKPGGILLYQTPNKYLNIIWQYLRWRNFKQIFVYHCSLQTATSLKRILRQAGFTNVKVHKYTIDTDFNQKKTKKVLGPIGPILLKVFDKFPLFLYPNLWGNSTK